MTYSLAVEPYKFKNRSRESGQAWDLIATHLNWKIGNRHEDKARRNDTKEIWAAENRRSTKQHFAADAITTGQSTTADARYVSSFYATKSATKPNYAGNCGKVC